MSSDRENQNLSSLLTEDLILSIASYLPAKDLLRFHCASLQLSRLDTDKLWNNLCRIRWNTWPRYRLTPERLEKLNATFSHASWKNHYLRVRKEATCTEINSVDLCNRKWYLSFSLSGVRGETRSDFLRVNFHSVGFLAVPGYPQLPFEIINETPPSCSNIRNNQRGDQPFSTKQWLRIADFPPHFITKRLSNAEWLIVNENVTFISTSD